MARIEIRCTNEERDRWKTSAGEAGLTFSDWVKQTLDGGAPAKRKPPLPEPDPPLLEVPAAPELEAKPLDENLVYDASLRERRAAAIEVGRRYGEHQAGLEGLRGKQRDQQVARAKRYAAWEFDGKPVGTEHARRYDKEFPGSAVDEAVSGPTLRALA